VFGRVAGSRGDYPYSEALQASRLVWDAATIDRLFEIGPETLIPGSKMPLQRMPDAADRAELVAFLGRITAPGGPQ
jgi:cytochrome c